MTGVDHYELLGVSPDSTTDEVRKAYRRLLKQVHPDAGGNAGMFRMVQEAWTVLSDADSRSRYDQDRSQWPPQQGTHQDERPPAQPAQPNPSAGPGEPAGQVDNGAVSPAATSWARLLAGGVEPERIGPQLSANVRLIRAATAATTVLLALLLGFMTHRAGMSWGNGVAMFLATVTTIAVALPQRWFGQAPYVAAGAWAASFCWGLTPVGVPQGPAWWLWAVVAGFAGVCALVVLVWDANGLDASIPVERLRDYVAFGTPGSGAPGTTPRVDVAARVGAETTMWLTNIPGTRILHRVKASERDTHGVDQVVVCGRKVALIVSTPAPAGRYSWSATTDSLLLEGAHITGGNVLAHVDQVAFEQALRKCEVRTFVLLHSTTGQVVCDNEGPGPRVTAGGPQEVLDAIGSWFLTEYDAKVDRHVIAKLAERML